MASQVRITQQLNGMGLAGAAMFIGAPALAGYLWQSSVSEYARKAVIFGADMAADELHAPIIYIILSAIAMTGLVMVLLGRDYISEPLA